MSMRNMGWATALAWSMAGSLIGLTGCHTPGYVEPEPEPPTSAVSRAAATLDQLKEQVHATLAALDLLEQSAQGNPRPAYRDFAHQLAGLERRVEQTRDQLWALQAHADQAYFEWERELYGITDPLVRVKDPKKRTQAKQSFDDILARLGAVKESAVPLISDLRDLKAFLAN